MDPSGKRMDGDQYATVLCFWAVCATIVAVGICVASYQSIAVVHGCTPCTSR